MSGEYKLPDFGDDWIDGMRDTYIILSLEKSTAECAVFWQADCLSYTDCLINAGKYSSYQIASRRDYYNDGLNTVAVPLTRQALGTLGLWPVNLDYQFIDCFLTRRLSDTRDRKL